MADRIFVVGQTVHLRMKVSVPGTRNPADPDQVTLVAFFRDNVSVALPTNVTFTKVTDGLYELVIPTVGFQPGVFKWRGRAYSGPLAVALKDDTFVLAV